jgi:adenylate cyclase
LPRAFTLHAFNALRYDMRLPISRNCSNQHGGDGPGEPKMAPAQSEFAEAKRAEQVIMFVETRGFTRTSEMLEPDVVVARVSEFLVLVANAVQQQGGAVVDVLNDTLMARFAGEADAQRGVRAAQDILRRFAALAETWQRDYGIHAAVAMGMHSGSAVIGLPDSEVSDRPLIIGDTVSVAERLLHRARAGEFVMSDKIIAAVGTAGADLGAEELPPLEIPRREPIGLYGVLLDTRLDFT